VSPLCPNPKTGAPVSIKWRYQVGGSVFRKLACQADSPMPPVRATSPSKTQPLRRHPDARIDRRKVGLGCRTEPSDAAFANDCFRRYLASDVRVGEGPQSRPQATFRYGFVAEIKKI
jgi:hypothetical protein